MVWRDLYSLVFEGRIKWQNKKTTKLYRQTNKQKMKDKSFSAIPANGLERSLFFGIWRSNDLPFSQISFQSNGEEEEKGDEDEEYIDIPSLRSNLYGFRPLAYNGLS